MTYNLFISHSWSYQNQYQALVNLLDKTVQQDAQDICIPEEKKFKYKNYSVPKDDPIHNANNDKQLGEAILNQMKPTSRVLVLAGIYAEYSKWIDIEIKLAKSMNKKIIAVEYWGSKRTSQFVKDNADDIVKWNTSTIVDAIKRPLCNPNILSSMKHRNDNTGSKSYRYYPINYS